MMFFCMHISLIDLSLLNFCNTNCMIKCMIDMLKFTLKAPLFRDQIHMHRITQQMGALASDEPHTCDSLRSLQNGGFNIVYKLSRNRKHGSKKTYQKTRFQKTHTSHLYPAYLNRLYPSSSLKHRFFLKGSQPLLILYVDPLARFEEYPRQKENGGDEISSADFKVVQQSWHLYGWSDEESSFKSLEVFLI